MRNRNFRAWNDVAERGSVTKNQKGEKAYVERKVGQCFQWKAQGRSSKGDSCSFSHEPQACGNKGRKGQRKKKDDRLLLHLFQSQNRLTAKATTRKAPCIKGVKFHAETHSVKIRHVSSGIIPCVRTTSLQEVVSHCDKNAVSDMLRQKESPTRSRRKGGAKGSVAILKESLPLCCVSQYYYSRKSIPREPGNWEQNTPSHSPKAPGTKLKILERKGPSRGIIHKCAPHERSPCAPEFEETLHQERCAREAAWDLAKNIYKLKNADNTTFLCSW